jgi:hypothetical protein
MSVCINGNVSEMGSVEEIRTGGYEVVSGINV